MPILRRRTNGRKKNDIKNSIRYFLEMPLSSQDLYLHLNISADDDGFVGDPKAIIRMIGASEDDFKILIAKSFAIIKKLHSNHDR